jgi:hypothetical protein
MKRAIVFLLAFGIVAVASPPVSEPSRTPVLVELFTSEGCSSCPPADRLLETLDRTQPVTGANIIVLSEHVDYWNSLGWRDPFSSASFSERQERYAKELHVESVYTPQLIVDGQFELVGSNADKAKEIIQLEAKREKAPLRIESLESSAKTIRVRISLEKWPSGMNGRATLSVAVASNQAQSAVSAGENSGRHLTHVAVVRSLQSLGEVDGGSPLNRNIAIPLKPSDKESVRIIAFLQDAKSQRVLAIAQLRP